MVKAFWQFDTLITDKTQMMGLPNDVIFHEGQFQGCLLDSVRAEDLIELLGEHADWRPRGEAEEDQDWQQIYVFGIVHYQDFYLELKRGTKASHTRLNGKYTLGVGGHVFAHEFEEHGNDLSQWMISMFHHDFIYEGNIQIKPVGVVNDGSDGLGRHHVLVLYDLTLDNDNLEAKNHGEARFIKLKDMTSEDVEYLERWSQMIYRQLLHHLEPVHAEGEISHFHVSQLMKQ